MFDIETIEWLNSEEYKDLQRRRNSCKETAYAQVHKYLEKKGFPQIISIEEMELLREDIGKVLIRQGLRSDFKIYQGDTIDSMIKEYIKEAFQREHSITACLYKAQRDGSIKKE